jgi:hypothetical protein
MHSMTDLEFRAQREPCVPPGGIELFASDMTATIAADVSLHALQQELATLGQWLPIDGDEAFPIGQLVEANSTGPLRLGFGAWRDLLLGCQLTTRTGKLITAGGRAMKNVAGYDLTKLMVGQQGALGQIVTITTRTYKRPAAFLTATFDRGIAISTFLATSCRPQWAVLNADHLFCGYAGDGAMIDWIETAIQQFKPTTVTRDDGEVRHHLWNVDVEAGHLAFRASVPPSRIQEFVKNAQLSNWVADPAFGIVRGSCTEEAPALRLAATRAGGRLWRESDEPLQTTDPVQANLLRRLIDAFDA